MNNITRFYTIGSQNGYSFKGLHTTAKFLQNKSSYNRQAKIFQKLLGTKKSGSKKYFVNNDNHPQIANPCTISRTKKEGKNANRRVTVLNKLFMKNITDLMATGNVSDEIVGKGIEISRVKITEDFKIVNVFWVAKGTSDDAVIEETLNKCSGEIRHELSQLKLMGEVPRIYFVKDKKFASLAHIDLLLTRCDFGDDNKTYDVGKQMRDELNLERYEYEIKDENTEILNDDPLPIMRHDILGLNHKDILDKILAKMKKSKQAWDQYEQSDVRTVVQGPGSETEKMLQKLETSKKREEEFEKFLVQRKYKKTPKERKHVNYYGDIPIEQSTDEDRISRYEDDGDFIDESENCKP